MNKAQKRPMLHKVLSMILALVMVLSLMPVSALAATDSESGSADFMRIFHLDCGRKYFTVDQIKELIDCAAENNYTHVELAFGNDGLRFLLDDMDVTVGTKNYDSNSVKTAINNGNKAFYNAGDKNELTQSEMDSIITHAKNKNIEIIPMFDAPGHLQAVIKAMQELGITMTENTHYIKASKSGDNSWNWAIKPTRTSELNFVQALVQKYIDYFAGKGCKYFNIAADECGFSSMSNAEYTAYAEFVNAMAQRIKNSGMTPMAFNDGIYHENLTLQNGVSFDTGIMICYWDATTNKYAPASELAQRGFKIINTHNKWYYVIGTKDTEWYGAEWSKGYMKGSSDGSKCDVTDGGYTTTTGCMNAVWCDNPGANADFAKIKDHIATLANVEYNKQFFVAAPIIGITSTADTLIVGGTTATLSLSNVSTGESVTWSVDDDSIVSLSTNADGSVTVTALTSGTVTVKATTADGKEYAYQLTVQSADELEQRTITVQVGKDNPVTVDGYVGTDGETVTIDEHASYTIKYNIQTVDGNPVQATSLESGEYIIGNGTRWIVLNGTGISSTTDSTQATKWTVTKSGNSYTIKNGDYYLVHNSNNNGVSASTSTSNSTWSWSSSNGFYYTSGNTTYYLYSYYRSNTYSWSVSNWSTNKNGANPYTVQPATEAGTTTITFKGLKAGYSEYVTIGNVRYRVYVTAEDLSKATKLPIQFWITNNIVQFDSTADCEVKATSGSFGYNPGGNAYYTEIEADKQLDGGDVINSEDGAPLSELIPSEREGLKEYANVYWDAEKQKTSLSGGDTWDNRTAQTLVLFQGVLLKNSVQTKLGNDLSNAGDEFRYVRYLNGVWQVSADRIDWKNVGANTGCTTGNSSSGGTQVVAYYMMRTEITKEVTTDVADWGYRDGESTYANQIEKNDVKGDYVTLDFAVKYQDGRTRNPDEFPIKDKTFLFHCNSGSDAVGTANGTAYRQLNNFRGMNSGNYEIYMVTVTMTSADPQTTITLEQRDNQPGKYEYNYKTEQIVWAINEETKDNSGFAEYESISGSSVYSGCKIGGDPYVRGVEVYNHHGALITYYVRFVGKTDHLTVNYIDLATDENFYHYSIGVSEQYGLENMTFNKDIALNTPWDKELINGSVKNELGVTQTVTANLKEMREVPTKYRNAIGYNCEYIALSDDQKTLNLYYTFKTEKTFVVDFGLPLVIQPTDVSETMAGATSVVAEATKNYAKVTVSGADVTYKLTSTMDGADKLDLTYTVPIETKEVTTEKTEYTVTIIPASTVYYEDSFASFEGGKGTAASATWSVDEKGGTPTTTIQALEALGDAKNVYGKDDAYADSTKYSMGSAHKVTVSADMVKDWNDNTSAWPTATFTFKGTGFDIISLTDNTSGTIFVDVVNSKKATVKKLFVDNYYGYKKDGDNWVVDKESANTLYQIPVMKVTDLPYDTYTVTIRLAYFTWFDHTGENEYTFVLDAIRVYDPMDKDYADYAKDNEGWPQYIKLRDKIAETGDTLGYALFIDGADEANIADYANYGPNNEVYLANGQAISFKIAENADIASIQIGAKAPNGTANLGGISTEEKVISTATEMYYEVENATAGNVVTIANTGDGILSLTNLKITYKTDPGESKASLVMMSKEEQTQVLMAVRALFAAPEPVVEPFAPERFEAKWNSVRTGRQATLTVKTSTDVEEISVNGETVDSYRTRYERSGWGPWAQKVEYREFTYTVKATETADYTVCAVNADGVSSEPITATLTVKPAQNSWWSNWWDGIFGKWF